MYPFFYSTCKQYYTLFVFVWLISLSMIISRSTHVAANGVISFFLIAELYFIVYIFYIFFTYSSVDGYLGCFQQVFIWLWNFKGTIRLFRLWIPPAWVWISTLPLTSCVSLVKFLHPLSLRFLICKTGATTESFWVGCC